jgi:aspartate kinase
MDYDHLIPSFIFKLDQVLFSITPKDFSFIVEENLSDIFETLSKSGIKINLMQNSALSFSFAVDQQKINIEKVLNLFKDKYEVKFNANLELITIRHYDAATISKMIHNKTVLIEQKTRQTVRFLARKTD